MKAKHVTRNLKNKRKDIKALRDKKIGGTNAVINRRVRKTGNNFLTDWRASFKGLFS